MKGLLATFELLQRALAFDTKNLNFVYDDDQLEDYGLKQKQSIEQAKESLHISELSH